MYCNNCGMQNPDGATYCNGCGKPITANAEKDSFNERKSNRNSEIIELERMIRYFSKMSDKYDEYDRLTSKINLYSKGKHHALLVWGIILLAIGTFVFSATTSQLSNDLKVLAAIVCLIPGAGMIVGYIFYSRNFDRNIYNLTEKRDKIADELMEYYEDYGICSVGAKYTNPTNLSIIKDTIQSGRADTIKEAINVLIDDTYRNKMQQLATQTAANTAATARATKATAVFSAANFFLK